MENNLLVHPLQIIDIIFCCKSMTMIINILVFILKQCSRMFPCRNCFCFGYIDVDLFMVSGKSLHFMFSPQYCSLVILDICSIPTKHRTHLSYGDTA